MVICVTSRKLCRDEFLDRIERLAKGKPHAIMLREKDLEPDDFEDLALKVNKICRENRVGLIISQNIETARKIGCHGIHLSMDNLRKYRNELDTFNIVGASIHSIDEAVMAENLDVSYLVAGHIYETDCKKGLEPRGIEFLRRVCRSVNIPVFAIGGINRKRVAEVADTGAKGVCIMSEAMVCDIPENLTSEYLSCWPRVSG